MDASRWMLRAPRVRKSSTTCRTLAISGTRSSSSRRNDGAVWLRRRRQRLYCPPIPAESKDPRRPLALLGFMGSGKTLVGALVAQRGRAAFFDLDHLVEDKAGMSVAEIFATHSEEAFRAFEKETLPGLLRPGALVALGGGGSMDGGEWRLVSEKASTVYLEVPFETIWQPIHRLPARPLIATRTASQAEAMMTL